MIPAILAVTAILCYLLGTLNAVRITSRIVFRRRMRPRTGDPAIVAMNRMFGVPGIIAVGVFDAAKTIVAVLLSGLALHLLGGEPVDSLIDYTAVGRIFGAFCVLLGHCFPVFYRFRGGKGGLVGLVALMCVYFPLGVLCGLIFVGLVAWTRFVSFGTIAGAIVAPIGVWLELGGLCALLCLFCSVIILFKHTRNIVHLIRKEEPRLDFRQDLTMKFEQEDF